MPKRGDLARGASMNKSGSIKSRIRGLLVIFTMILSLLLVLLMLAYSWLVEDNIFNRMVLDETRYLEQHFQATGELASARYPFMTLYSGWSELPESVQLLHQQSPERVEFPLPNRGTIHTRSVQLGQQSWLLVANVSAYEVSRDYLPALLRWLAAMILLVCLVAIALSIYLSNWVVKPIEYLADKVASHDGKMPLKFTRPLKSREMSALGAVIETNVNRFQKALKRETDFTRDISHELRTPTTVLKMKLSTLSAGSELSSPTLSQLKQSSQQIEQTIEVLLALSRDESLATEKLSLLAQIEQSLITHPVLARADDYEVSVAVSAGFYVVTNANLLQLLLNNLLDNAVNHTSESVLSIQLTGSTLSVINPISSADKAVVSDALIQPGEKSQASRGMGQGLHLVQRICDRFGWQLSVQALDDFQVDIKFGD